MPRMFLNLNVWSAVFRYDRERNKGHYLQPVGGWTWPSWAWLRIWQPREFGYFQLKWIQFQVCKNLNLRSVKFVEIHDELRNFFLNIQDIQVRNEDLDERKIAMAQRYTHSRHYLTYQHSLRVRYFILKLSCKLPQWYLKCNYHVMFLIPHGEMWFPELRVHLVLPISARLPNHPSRSRRSTPWFGWRLDVYAGAQLQASGIRKFERRQGESFAMLVVSAQRYWPKLEHQLFLSLCMLAITLWKHLTKIYADGCKSGHGFRKRCQGACGCAGLQRLS